VLGRLIYKWEERLNARDRTQRVSLPFEWGLEYLGIESSADPVSAIENFNSRVLKASEDFFAPSPAEAADFDFDGSWLHFPSGVLSPYQVNNTVHARFFESPGSDRAVIVSPQWNADVESHVGVCRLLNRAGISALRLSLPYHDRRMPEDRSRADFMVSANIGRTIQAVRQAVQDVRRAADWLIGRGIRHVGVLGTSIGSCVSWLALIHDSRLEAGALNLVSSYFGDVVWRGMTTTHVRRSLEEHMTLDEVRRVWLTISPIAYSKRLRERRHRLLIVSAKYDPTFLPELSRQFIESCDGYAGIRQAELPCGHYTLGAAPFKYLDAWHLISFFRKAWE
jgi:hypothetical protein